LNTDREINSILVEIRSEAFELDFLMNDL